MGEVRYICTGSCGGSVSEEEFIAGKNTCASPNCEKHGQPLEKNVECPECGANSEDCTCS